jgi:putative oxidoreductase
MPICGHKQQNPGGNAMSLEVDLTRGVDEKRLVFPALARLYKPFAPYSYAFMRFSAGAILVPHGYAKLFEGGVWRTGGVAAMGLWPPLAWSFLVAGVEFFGAIMLAIGLFTRFAAAAIAIEMLVIVSFKQWQYGYFWTSKGYEFALLWALLAVAIFFRGGGRASVDHWLGREL